MSSSDVAARDDDDDDDVAAEDDDASLIDALLVYAEPLAADAHAIVVGNAETGIADRLLELGARGVYVFDPDPARAAHAARYAPRGVTIRALVDDLDVRDGAFDLAVVPDLADLNDPRAIVNRLRRAVAATGAVVCMGRAKLGAEQAATAAASDEDPPFGSELGPAALEYAELYDLFAVQFDEVTIAGVVPFRGVVFAELGAEDDAPSVSVDTRLATPDPPSVFVIVAGQLSTTGHGNREAERAPLDPYAIVQLSSFDDAGSGGDSAAAAAAREDETIALEAAIAATQLKAELLATQLEETRDRLVVADVRSVEAATRLDRATSERDASLTRAMELEAVLAASQQTMATLERRLLEAEQGMLERDDRIATLSAELDTARSQQHPVVAVVEQPVPVPVAIAVPMVEAVPAVDIEALVTRAERAEAALSLAVAEMSAREDNAATYADTRIPDITSIVARAERAEAALALNSADLSHIQDTHAQEMHGYEERLRERARFIAEIEKELVRRELLVKELIQANTELLETNYTTTAFEAAAPLSLPAPAPAPLPLPATNGATANGNGGAEVATLREKLDQLASEIARREGELEARGWRITELENLVKRSSSVSLEEQPTGGGGSKKVAATTAQDPELQARLGRAQNELDALRQALAQEHSARLQAESGEELTRARAELARQATLLEQVRSRSE